MRKSADRMNPSVRIGLQRFRYKGFRVAAYNLTDSQIRMMLDAIDYAVALFKRRGMTDVIYSAISEVILIEDPNLWAAGTWRQRDRVLTLNASKLSGRGRLLNNWVHEVFIHEVGHWVHMNYISREAKEFWDSGWSYIDEEKERFSKENLTKLAITPEDRKRYFEVFKESKGDLKAVKRKVSALDALKIHYLLAHLYDYPLMTPKNFRLNGKGKEMMAFFKDPLDYFYNVLGYSEDDYTEEQAIKRGSKKILVSIFKIKGYYEDISLTLHGEKADALIKEDKALHEKVIEEMKQAIGIPTDYGRIDFQEDFAETFVWFITDPSRLSDTARWRMGRTLGLSEATGKKVMRVARLVRRYMRSC